MGEDPSQDDPCNREGSEHEGESKALFWPPNGDAPVNDLGGYAQPLLALWPHHRPQRLAPGGAQTTPDRKWPCPALR
jgi:hypothetical protein